MSTTTCPRCHRERHRGRCKRAEAEAAPTAPAPAVITGPHLEIARGWGLRARVEDGTLTIEQDQVDADGAEVTATVFLSRTELTVLAAQFAEWAAS